MNIFSRYFWKDGWYKIRCFFNHRNKWAERVIPSEYSDKPELIKNFLFAAIVNYVEPDGEDCFNVTDWDWQPESQEIAKKIKEIYDYIKVERPELDKQYWASFPENVPLFSNVKINHEKYEELYGENNRLEALLDAQDEKYLKMIIELRQTLWT